MPIKNLSDIRRLPRLGKISLGIKKTSEKSGKEYPHEVDYFVCPSKVEEVYKGEPKELRIMFPVEDPDVFFQQWYKSYGFNLLKCKGDGEKAFTWDEEHGGMKEITCPCDKLQKGECKKIGILQFLLPDVPGAGCWQITTSSRDSIININSSVDYIKQTCGRIRMIPLILKRIPNVKQRIEKGKPKKSTHYTLQIDVENITLRQLQEAAQIAPERVLLPPTDETKDELFYPENGFKPEEPAKPKEDIEPLKQELSFIVKKFKDLGGSLTQKEGERLDVLGTVEGYEDAIKHFKVKLTALEGKEEKPKKGKDSEKPEDLFEEEDKGNQP